MPLTKQYRWLADEPGTRMIKEALSLLDTSEVLGVKNNPTIIAWAKEVGGNVADVYKADSIPWCGLFMAVVGKRANKEIVAAPLWALNWGNFGHQSPKPMLGDVLVFVRRTSNGSRAGHVALYVGEDNECFHILGGNQSDKVCVTRIKKNRLYAARRPNYNVQPSNVRVIKLTSKGSVSTDEQ